MSIAIVIFMILVAIAFGGIVWWGREVMREHPIRAIAVLCVAIIGGYIMWMGYWHTVILSSPDWCAKAIQAERITPGSSFAGLTACIDLLTIQVKAEATNSHIYAGSTAASLLALIVIVIAGGQLSGKMAGMEIAIGQAVQNAVKAAVETSAKINGNATPVAPPVVVPTTPPPVPPQEHKGAAMPEPKE